MNKRNIWHVLPHSRGWQLKRRGGKRATRVTQKQSESIRIGIRIARNNKPSQFFIHDRSGKIRGERTYGQDPEETPG